MSQPWHTVYVFISSTFNDMHAERDCLVKQVFPRLREWCEQRKLMLVDVDLRWGVTEADATANRGVVQTVLRRIDDCRPFFICFLGQRRGWVPSPHDVSDETFDYYPGLDPYVGEASVTELEILHALIHPFHGSPGRSQTDAEERYEPSRHASFYLREPSYLEEMPD